MSVVLVDAVDRAVARMLAESNGAIERLIRDTLDRQVADLVVAELDARAEALDDLGRRSPSEDRPRPDSPPGGSQLPRRLLSGRPGRSASSRSQPLNQRARHARNTAIGVIGGDTRRSVRPQPQWSPDGEWIAFTDGENEADVWVVRPDGTGLRQLTTVG